MSNPLVTVWLTSYNQGKYLRESIDSVLNQTFKDFELIICDDCSTDDSWEIIQSYDDPRIEKRRNEVNKGAHVTYEIIDACRGKYIAIHHSDDAWELDKLEKQVAFMETHTEYAACFTKVKFINENSEIWELPEGNLYKKIFEQENRSKEEWLNHFFYKGNCLCHPSILIRKDRYRKYDLLGNFGLFQLPDFFNWIKICLRENIYIYPEYLIKFRIRVNAQDNVSSDRLESMIRIQYEFIKIYKIFEKIDNKDIFLKIFPNAEKYNVKGEINLKYALAQLLYEIDKPAAKLLAIDLLFAELNDVKNKEQLKRLYGYDFNNFVKDTANNDIFAVQRKFKILHSKLYIDVGEGFNELNVIDNVVYVRSDNSFYLKYDLSPYNKVKAIRFDPDNKAIKIKLITSEFDGDVCWPEWSNYTLKDNQTGYDVFYTDNPIYYYKIYGEKLNNICISGLIENIDMTEVGCIYKEALIDKEKLKIDKEKLEKEINAIKSTRGYRLLEKARKIFRCLKKIKGERITYEN